jgi:hypothetical protein
VDHGVQQPAALLAIFVLEVLFVWACFPYPTWESDSEMGSKHEVSTTGYAAFIYQIGAGAWLELEKVR